MAQRGEAREPKEPREVEDLREPAEARAPERASPLDGAPGKPTPPVIVPATDSASLGKPNGSPLDEPSGKDSSKDSGKDSGMRASAPLESLSARDEPIPAVPPPPVAGPWRSYKEILAGLAQRVLDAQRPIRILQALRWDAEVEDQFLRSNRRELQIGRAHV